MLTITIEQVKPGNVRVQRLTYPLRFLRGRMLAKTVEMMLNEIAKDGTPAVVSVLQGDEPMVVVEMAGRCPRQVGALLKAWVEAEP